MNNDKQTSQNSNEPQRKWERPVLTDGGNVATVLQGGGGKLSLNQADTGDAPRKPSGLA
jgi:hypothetical protein